VVIQGASLSSRAGAR